MKKLKNLSKKVVYRAYAYMMYRIYRNINKNNLSRLGIKNKPVEGEEEYIRKWSVFNNRVEPYSYRFLSRFMGHNPNIIPEDIGHVFIENILNPCRYRSYYSDKNFQDIIYGKHVMPKTFLRRIHHSKICDQDYQIVDVERTIEQLNASKVQKLIVKPSIDTDSGVGVRLLTRDGDGFKDVESKQILSEEYLYNFGGDFILQEALAQSPYISQFNRSSANTFRIATYRSVSDEEVHVTGSLLRIGKEGQFVDNAHAGGVFVEVNTKTGEVGKYVMNHHGYTFTECNGIDFSQSNFVIPNWDTVIEFSKYIGKCNHHCRFLALDVALDENNQPKLIECNVDGFGFWVFMYINQNPFGEFTDEIINHCLKYKDELSNIKMF